MDGGDPGRNSFEDHHQDRNKEGAHGNVYDGGVFLPQSSKIIKLLKTVGKFSKSTRGE